MSAFLSVFPSVCVCVSVYTINNGLINFKLVHVVVFENSTDEFDIGRCLIYLRLETC